MNTESHLPPTPQHPTWEEHSIVSPWSAPQKAHRAGSLLSMMRPSQSGTPGSLCSSHPHMVPVSQDCISCQPQSSRCGGWGAVIVAQDTVGQGCKNQCGCMFCSARPVPPLCQHAQGTLETAQLAVTIQVLQVARDSRLCGSVGGSCYLEESWGGGEWGGVFLRMRPSDLPAFPTDC